MGIGERDGWRREHLESISLWIDSRKAFSTRHHSNRINKVAHQSSFYRYHLHPTNHMSIPIQAYTFRFLLHERERLYRVEDQVSSNIHSAYHLRAREVEFIPGGYIGYSFTPLSST